MNESDRRQMPGRDWSQRGQGQVSVITANNLSQSLPVSHGQDNEMIVKQLWEELPDSQE